MAGTGLRSASSGNHMRAASFVPSRNGISVCSITRTAFGNFVTITARSGSKIQRDVGDWRRTADKSGALGRRVERHRMIAYAALDEAAFAHVTDAAAARPFDRDGARLGQL